MTRPRSTMRPASLCGLLLAVFTAHAAAQAPTYTATLIADGEINAAAMNEAGDVVGTGTSASGGWVSYAGAPAVLLPVPPGALYTFANDINDAGVIVGSAGPSSYPGLFGKAVAWYPDGSGGYVTQQLGTLPGHAVSDATAVNNVGDIVGYSFSGMFRKPVLFTGPGGIEDLTATGVFDPVDVNDHRVLVDHSFTAKRLDLSTMTVQDLGAPGPDYVASRGEAINESGQVAGSARLATSTNCDHQSARYTDGVGWQILSGCGQTNSAWDMNDLGDVVMRLNVAPYVRFEGIGTFLIEDLIVADAGHWYVINGYGLTINNSRQMAVPASNDVTGEAGIVLLTPIEDAQPCDGDFDQSGDVGFDDLTQILVSWGPCAPPCPPDLDDSDDVGFGDLTLLLIGWGACPTA